MDDTLNRLLGNDHNDKNDNRISFIPSKTWQGPKPGYFFGTSDDKLGIGYYLDDHKHHHKTKKRSNSTVMTEEELSSKVRKNPKTGAELLAEAEASVLTDKNGMNMMIALTPSGIKSAVSNLCKLLEKNQILRIEHAEDPVQFMESELALNEAIDAFKAVAAADVSLYADTISSETLGGTLVDALIALLAHDNQDIAVTTLELLVELVDLDLLTSPEALKLAMPNTKNNKRNPVDFVNMFMEKGGLELAVTNLGRLCYANVDVGVDIDRKRDTTAKDANDITKENENLDAADNILTLIETIIDLEQMNIIGQIESTSLYSVELVRNTKLVGWLMDRIEREDDNYTGLFSPIKLHAAELLSSLLQLEECRKTIGNLGAVPKFAAYSDDIGNDDKISSSSKAHTNGNMSDPSQSKNDSPAIDGIEIFLQSIAKHRKKDPKTDEECEFLENCFDALSASLLTPTNVEGFLKGQGIELMLRCIREKVHSGNGALKVLYFSLSGNDMTYEKACNVFVDAGGLKTIFPVFMGKTSAIPKPAMCSEAGVRNHEKNSKKTKRSIQAKKAWLGIIETHTLQIMYSLIIHINNQSLHDGKARFIRKFIEDDFAKCDRLLELFIKYDKKMRTTELKYFRSEQADLDESEGVDVDLAAWNAKMQGGGDLFFKAGAILSYVMVGSKECCKHISSQLKLKGSGLSGKCIYYQ